MHKTVPNQLISGQCSAQCHLEGLLSKFDQVAEAYQTLVSMWIYFRRL